MHFGRPPKRPSGERGGRRREKMGSSCRGLLLLLLLAHAREKRNQSQKNSFESRPKARGDSPPPFLLPRSVGQRLVVRRKGKLFFSIWHSFGRREGEKKSLGWKKVLGCLFCCRCKKSLQKKVTTAAKANVCCAKIISKW